MTITGRLVRSGKMRVGASLAQAGPWYEVRAQSHVCRFQPGLNIDDDNEDDDDDEEEEEEEEDNDGDYDDEDDDDHDDDDKDGNVRRYEVSAQSHVCRFQPGLNIDDSDDDDDDEDEEEEEDNDGDDDDEDDDDHDDDDEDGGVIRGQRAVACVSVPAR